MLGQLSSSGHSALATIIFQLTSMKPTRLSHKPASFSLTSFATTSLLALLALSPASRAADAAWGSNAGTAWYTATNWAGGAFPGLQGAAASNTDIATFTNVATATTFGINMNTASLNLGAIFVDSPRTAVINIGNSSTSVPGELRLYGATVNGVADTIIRHNTVGITGTNTVAGTLTLQAAQSGGGSMGVVLSNAAGNNVNIDNGGSVVISAPLSGTGPLTKGGTGTGPLILSGANSYSGGTNVNTGTLSFNTVAAKTGDTHTFAAGTTLGLGLNAAGRFTAAEVQQAFGPSAGYTGNLAGISIGDSNNIAIDTSSGVGAQTFGASIGPSPRGLEKILGGSNLTLTGSNEYSGRTVVWGGSGLVMDNPGTIGATSSNLGTNSTVDLMTGAFFQITAPTSIDSNKTLNIAALNGGTVIIFGAGSATNTITLSGSITAETPGTKTVDFRTNTVGTHNVTGVISDGSGRLNVRKSNAGTWILSAANTYTGNTIVAAGTLILNDSHAAQNSTLDTTASIAGTGSAGLRTTVTTLTLGGLSGNKNLASVFTTTSGGYSDIAALTLNPGTGLSPAYAAAIADGALGMTLTKTGAGTQTLSGTNTYTGATAVSAGTLALGAAGSIATSPSLAIAAEAVFDISAQASYAIPATQPVEFGINSAATGTSGQITAAGLDVTGAAVTYNITGTPDDPAYVLATYTSLTGTFASVPAPPVGYVLDYAYQGNKIALVSTAPPTPYATWSGGALPNLDANNDSVMNGVAWVLGAANPNALAVADLPTLDNTSDPNFVIFNYRRSDLANADTNTVIKAQYGTTLTTWTDAVAGTDIIITPSNDFYAAGIDKVEVKIRRTLAPDGRIFARLTAVITQ
jgi:autotransporter-associated beta strand protein